MTSIKLWPLNMEDMELTERDGGSGEPDLKV
jgi:hypothetical protein